MTSYCLLWLLGLGLDSTIVTTTPKHTVIVIMAKVRQWQPEHPRLTFHFKIKQIRDQTHPVNLKARTSFLYYCSKTCDRPVDDHFIYSVRSTDLFIQEYIRTGEVRTAYA
jgi:hypothetical protein